MVTSLYELKILDWGEKLKKKPNKQTSYKMSPEYM